MMCGAWYSTTADAAGRGEDGSIRPCCRVAINMHRLIARSDPLPARLERTRRLPMKETLHPGYSYYSDCE